MRWLGLPTARERHRPLRDATTYEEWRAVASELDAETGADAWRREAGSRSYDAALLEEHTDSLRALRESGRFDLLASVLEEALYRHLGELANPKLYEVALLGTKELVERFFVEAETAIDVLGRPDVTGLDRATTRARIERAASNFGRSALMLSGGASLGFFHLGVCKALFEHGLLPTLLSGASMGAMVACGIGSRTDAELRTLFADLRVLRTDALAPFGPVEAVRHGAMFDPRRLEDVIVHNNGDFTFAEAYARTGRIIGVSVSPTRERQKPRVLSHLTTPDVLLRSAAVASSSVPGAFPATALFARSTDGTVVPFHGTERWLDGSFRGDLPMRRLGRLFNVNHFIVSQVNPHVAPVRRLTERRGLVPFAVDVATESVRVQLAHQLDVARRVLARTPLRGPIELAHSLADQDYGGDIDIHPPVRPVALARTLANISHAELERHVLEGERSTWPLLVRIRNETRIERALHAVLSRLDEETRRGEAPPTFGEPLPPPRRTLGPIMPTTFLHGDLFEAAAERTGRRAIAFGADATGAMDAGVAVAFRNRFPAFSEAFRAHAEATKMQLGDVFAFEDGELTIYALAIQHAGSRPKLSHFERALRTLVERATASGVQAVLFPRVGAGKNGLDWMRVKRLFEGLDSKGLELVVYEQFVRKTPNA